MRLAQRPDFHRLRHQFRALRSRNYRRFFWGQLVSLAGTWMTLMAMGWLVYRLTGDPLMLGLVGFCSHVPTFLLSPVAGALVDRWNRRKVLVVVQVADMLTVLTLAALALAHQVEVWHLLVGCSLLGVSKAFDLPARQALVVEILEHRDDLPNAIALNSSVFHGARMVGPVLGGLIIAAAGPDRQGEGLCFLLDGFSYLAAIGALLALRLPKPASAEAPVPKPLLRDMATGFRYVFGPGPMRSFMLLVGALALLGIPYGTLLPAIAREVLGGSERTYSALIAASGLGAVVGAMYLAGRSSVLGLGRVIACCTVMFGLALALFSFSAWLWLSLPLLVVASSGSMIAMAGTNTILQTLVTDAMRGRVMSFMGMTFMGAMPLGALLAGKFASLLGAPNAVLISGLASVTAGTIFAWRLPQLRGAVRPLLIERGLLPPVGEVG